MDRLLNEVSVKGGPDMVGMSLNLNVVDGYGGGASISLFAITNGTNRGFYATITPTIRLGLEDGASASIFKGYYIGKGSPNPSDYLGNSLDITSTSANGAYYWQSFGKNPLEISWFGFGKSYAKGDIGASIGYGSTLPLYGFKKK
jgi:hypothetical protein